MRAERAGVPVDVVRYPYRLLDKPIVGPAGFPTAGLQRTSTQKITVTCAARRAPAARAIVWASADALGALNQRCSYES